MPVYRPFVHSGEYTPGYIDYMWKHVTRNAHSLSSPFAAPVQLVDICTEEL